MSTTLLVLLVVAALAVADIAVERWAAARRARAWHVDCIYCGFHGTYRGTESLERGTTWHRQMCHPGEGSPS